MCHEYAGTEIQYRALTHRGDADDRWAPFFSAQRLFVSGGDADAEPPVAAAPAVWREDRGGPLCADHGLFLGDVSEVQDGKAHQAVALCCFLVGGDADRVCRVYAFGAF